VHVPRWSRWILKAQKSLRSPKKSGPAKKEKRAWDAETALSDRMKSDDAFRGEPSRKGCSHLLN